MRRRLSDKRYYDRRAVRLAACRQCKAAVGEKCRGAMGYPVEGTHYSRRQDATRIARGLPIIE